MKAKFVFESIEFRRGVSSKDALGVGHYSFGPDGQKKSHEEWTAEVQLGHEIKWSSKAFYWRAVMTNEITPEINAMMEDSNLYVIPHEELHLEDRFITTRIPEKYSQNILGIWDKDKENLYLMDAQGYDYPRYLAHIVPQQGTYTGFLSESINFQRTGDSKKSLRVGEHRFQNQVDSNHLETLMEVSGMVDRGDNEGAKRYIRDELGEAGWPDNHLEIFWYLWDLYNEGVIEEGKFFDHKQFEDMFLYLEEESKGRFPYNAYPGGDGAAVFFSKIPFPQAELIEDL